MHQEVDAIVLFAIHSTEIAMQVNIHGADLTPKGTERHVHVKDTHICHYHMPNNVNA